MGQMYFGVFWKFYFTRYDFFLVSQHVRQGTVSPTHYIVLHDNIGLPPERNQALAYKMTHLYYNWPGTVRVPAPCLVSCTDVLQPYTEHNEILTDTFKYDRDIGISTMVTLGSV